MITIAPCLDVEEGRAAGGWSGFDEGSGSPGVGNIIERLAPRVVESFESRNSSIGKL